MRATKLLSVALVALLASAASASAQVRFGYDGTDGPILMAEAAQGGANVTRIGASWPAIQPTKHGGYNFAGLDIAYAASLASGERPLILIDGSPCWARPHHPCRWFTVAPNRRSVAAYAKLAGRIARRYPRAIGLEIWNEPNLIGNWGSPPTPRRYARLVKAAAKAVHGRLPIYGGVTAPRPGWRGYLAGVVRRARRAIDVVDVHLYPHRKQHAAKQVLHQEAAVARIAGRLPVAVTEVGFSTRPGTSYQPEFSATQQASMLARVLRTLIERGVKTTLVYRLRDVPGDPGADWDLGMGVLHANGKPKPAFRALARTIREARRLSEAPRPSPAG